MERGYIDIRSQARTKSRNGARNNNSACSTGGILPAMVHTLDMHHSRSLGGPNMNQTSDAAGATVGVTRPDRIRTPCPHRH